MKNARGLFLVPFFLFAAAAAFPAGGQSQGPPNQDFSMIKMCARIADYDNRFDLSDPLKSFVYYQYLQASGKQSLLRSVHSFRIKGFFPPPNAPDLPVRRESREAILNTEIRGMIRYQDSVAGIITTFQAPLFLITYYSKEDGHWLRAGEDLGNDLEDAYRVFKNKARNFAETIEIIGRQKNVSTNPAVLSAYLERLGKSPKEFMKDALGRHRLVIYGEIHRRKASWDFLRDLIADPVFVHRTGTIFLELSSDKQDVLDAFFLKDKLDPVSLWDIFQNVQINGWYDRGVYEFLIDAWRLNHRLPGPKKVRVVAVDVPRPFASFASKEEMDKHFAGLPDRNTYMAETIFRSLQAGVEKRNALFIVGILHAFKSKTPGIADGRPPGEARPTAAAQLAARFPPLDVYSIFSHGPIIGNDGTIHGRIRNGLLDEAFKALGNRPVAFAIAGSPIAAEPFDAIYEIGYHPLTGSFQKNFDAYIFLAPLASEAGEYLFVDFITDAFVAELKRRARMVGTTLERWFGIEEPTKEALLDKLKRDSERKRRWPEETAAGRTGASSKRDC